MSKVTSLPLDDGLQTVLNCAVRYSLGRHTYIPSLVAEFIKPLIGELSNKTKTCMKQDISDYLHSSRPFMNNLDADRKVWIELLNELNGLSTGLDQRSSVAV